MSNTVRGQLRPMKCVLAFLEKADGSCSFSQGTTTVWSSASGPGDVHIARRENDKMHIDVSFRNANGDNQHNKFNNILESTLADIIHIKLFPRCCLTITIQSLQSDGSLGAAALTAASLAVLDNGVPCRAPFCGVQVVRFNGQLILDPDAKTEAAADCSFLFALEKTSENVIAVVCSDCTGPFNMDDYRNALTLAMEAAEDIFVFFKETLQRKLSVDIFTKS